MSSSEQIRWPGRKVNCADCVADGLGEVDGVADCASAPRGCSSSSSSNGSMSARSSGGSGSDGGCDGGRGRGEAARASISNAILAFQVPTNSELSFTPTV
jgi:hypothetical protein